METAFVIAAEEVATLLDALRDEGYRVIGPRRRDGAIVYDDVTGPADLPVGWTDEQAPGRYGLRQRDDEALFGYAVGPDSWKRELFPPRRRLSTTTLDEERGGFRVVEEPSQPQRVAFLGVRGCELAAMAVQDGVLLRGLFPDTDYAVRREHAAIIAVDCFAPAATCFCTSMRTGPRARDGADLTLTELVDDGPHELLVRPHTALGARLAGALHGRPATAADLGRGDELVDRAASSMQRELDADAAHDVLLGALEHPRWDDVAQRCLACGNCTLACPTCFCTEVEDVTTLDATTAHRDRRWDSCFNVEFSHVGPGSVRSSVHGRYRQWMTHKLATWIDQFGTSGCVGCGRCITWCPVGIDITAEFAAIAATPDARPRTPEEHRT